mmetsp:Transcript_10324/g.29404  ORF Transcript_10324/g.29404 Transcript_10324/m.29404 type:complete len:224 (-) Transcript_10324:294-965(-)
MMGARNGPPPKARLKMLDNGDSSSESDMSPSSRKLRGPPKAMVEVDREKIRWAIFGARPVLCANVASSPSSATPGPRSDRWSRCFTLLVFFCPFDFFLLTRSIFVNRFLQRGHEFSRSAHFSMHSKQNMCSHPLMPARSSPSTSHMQMQQLSVAACFFSSSSSACGLGGAVFSGAARALFLGVGVEAAALVSVVAVRRFRCLLLAATLCLGPAAGVAVSRPMV